MFMDICIMVAICVTHLVHDTTLLSLLCCFLELPGVDEEDDESDNEDDAVNQVAVDGYCFF